MDVDTIAIEEPRAAKWLFASKPAAWVWLVARLWLGWEWLAAGWEKTFGGRITAKFWDWGDAPYRIWGSGNAGWVRGGTKMVETGAVQVGVGDNVAGFAQGALATGTQGAHPDIAFSWYANFLEWVRDTAHPVIGPVVAIGELLIGVALIVGAFVGIAAFFGAILNFSFAFAGSAGLNPAMIGIALLLVLAWRNAGYIGLDRYLLPKLGTPWHRGALLRKRKPAYPRAA